MSGFWKSGDPFVWLTGGTLAASVLMVVGLVSLILMNALGFFWPSSVDRFDLADGRTVIGEIALRELIPDPEAALGTPARYRLQVKQGNRDVYGVDFIWIDEDQIRSRGLVENVVVSERREWGNLYGLVKVVKDGDKILGEGESEGYAALTAALPSALKLNEQIEDVEKGDVGAVNAAQEAIRLKLRGLELDGVTSGEEVDELKAKKAELDAEYEKLLSSLNELRAKATASVVFVVAGGQEKEVPLSLMVRAYQPNRMGFLDKVGFYASKIWEFVADEPRESNTEGGIFPAIFGTVMMVFIMSVIATPLGVLAAFYLREYSKQGAFVSAVRIAVNNLAGVPSIVYGVFGVGFFIYLIGGSIDRLFFRELLPTPTYGTGGILWASLTLALLTVPVVIVAVEEGLAAIPRGIREASLALGATKFETTWRVVFPAVLPSVLTGMILAVARAAGEVAPLMLTGVVKLAPALPLDGTWPFFHFDRKFMHLGFHIYDVGFQSPNVDASRPMVFMTTLLLLMLVLALNLFAITMRNRLKKRLATSGL
jgi:phosphate transport system permease protein